MKRYHLTIPQGAHQVEEVVILEGDDSAVEGTAGFMALVGLMRIVLDNPTVLRHAHDCPTEVRFSKNAQRWMAEARSLISVSDGDSPTSPSQGQ